MAGRALTVAAFIRFEEVTADLGAPLVDGEGARAQYREGYFICAKESATALRLRQGDNRSAMPILFLYRHYVEIALKDVLHRSKVFDLSQSEEKVGHNLEALWAGTESALKAFIGGEWLGSIAEAVKLFSAVDKRADAFRYATNPQGDPQMPKNAHVVYHELIAQMEEVRAAIDLAFGEIARQENRLDRAIDDAVARDPF
jgi:hypothetical protein